VKICGFSGAKALRKVLKCYSASPLSDAYDSVPNFNARFFVMTKNTATRIRTWMVEVRLSHPPVREAGFSATCREHLLA
jgi:hypothetical protein